MRQGDPSQGGIGIGWWALAALGPLAVLGAALWLLALRGEDTATSEAAQAIEAELAAADASVIAVGNSLVGLGLDADALSRLLGLGEGEVHTLWVAGTRPPHWYLLLKNRLFANGHRPRVILVVNTLQALLETRVVEERQRARLAEHMGEHEPVIQEKTFGEVGGDSLYRRRAQTRRGAFQASLLDGARDLVVGALFAGLHPDGLLAAGHALAEPAMAEVFDAEGAVDMDLHSRVIPVVERESAAASLAGAADPAGSFIPDLAALAAAHGARLVIVRIPVSERAHARSEVPLETERAALELLNGLGVGYVDLHDLPLENRHFRDVTHLNSAGREAFTAALGDALARLGALGEGALPPAAIPLALMAPPEVERVGQPPALPPLTVRRAPSACGWLAPLPGFADIGDRRLNALGLGRSTPVVLYEDGAPLRPFAARADYDACVGAFAFSGGAYLTFSPAGDDPEAPRSRRYVAALSDAVPLPGVRGEVYWVYPGTALRFRFPDAGEGPLTIAVEAAALGPGAGEPVITLGGAQASLGGGERRAAEVTAAGGAGALEIRSPPDGPYLALTRLAITRGGETAAFIGEAERAPPAVSLLGNPARSPPTFASAPPPLPPVAEVSPTRFPGAGRIYAPELASITDNRLMQRTLAKGCSPVRVFEDGAPLPSPNRPCGEVREGAPGRSCHAGEGLLFTSGDGSDPAANGRAYTLGLDPARRCRLGWWIYPGDTMRGAAAPAQLRRLTGGGSALALAGFTVGEGAPVRVRLLVGEEVWHEAQVATLDGEATLILETPTPPEATAVGLEVASAPDSVWLVLSKASLL